MKFYSYDLHIVSLITFYKLKSIYLILAVAKVDLKYLCHITQDTKYRNDQ